MKIMIALDFSCINPNKSETPFSKYDLESEIFLFEKLYQSVSCECVGLSTIVIKE